MMTHGESPMSIPMPQPAYRGASAPRTLRSPEPGKVFTALLSHGIDAGCAWGLLRSAMEHGDGQVERARVTFDGTDWTCDLFGQRREAAA